MLGILCGLESEAVIARKVPGALVACAAARPHKARDLARDLVARGATRLLSFGVAGGLDTALPIGALVIGSQIVSATGDRTCEPAWQEELARAFPRARRGKIWGSETLIATGREKQALRERTGCLIVDMESQCAAEAGEETGVPVGVLRSICDGAATDVPPVVMASIREDGSTDARRALFHLLRHPLEIPRLAHVGWGMRRALRTLEECAAAMAPVFSIWHSG